MLSLYIKYIIYNINYMNKNIHLNIFKTYAVCVCLYNTYKYTQYTHICYVNKTFILDAINHLTALI